MESQREYGGNPCPQAYSFNLAKMTSICAARTGRTRTVSAAARLLASSNVGSTSASVRVNILEFGPPADIGHVQYETLLDAVVSSCEGILR